MYGWTPKKSYKDREGGSATQLGRKYSKSKTLFRVPAPTAGQKKKEIFPTDRQFQYVVHLVAEITDDLVRR